MSEINIDGHDDSQPKLTTAEAMIQDPEVRARIKKAFDELDAIYAGIHEKTEYEVKGIDVTSITPSGQVIEAIIVATPLPKYDSATATSPEVLDAIERYHETTEYMIFSFNLYDLLSPDFTLKPLDLRDANVTEHRGSGIDIVIPNGPSIHLPQQPLVYGRRNDRIRFNGEETETFQEFRVRSGIDNLQVPVN